MSPHHLDGGCDIVFQIGIAKYGVRDLDGQLDLNRLRTVAERSEIKMFELKMSQGAKPGKGCILPVVKVTLEIAAIRGMPVQQASLSPNSHTDVRNVSELADMIARIRETTPKPVGFKTVVAAYGWLNGLCEESNKRGIEAVPDFTRVDSGDGGTGAAPMPLLDNVGLPVKESLPMVADVLTRHGMRDRVKLIASGKLITPAEIAWAYCAGADVSYRCAVSCSHWAVSRPQMQQEQLSHRDQHP